MSIFFADEGITETSTKKRKVFHRMIACAKSGAIDLIITKEISRFARNTLDSIYFTRELKKLGVGVIFLSDNINTLDADAERRLTIMSSIAQEESRKTSNRVKRGQTRQMERGVVFGRSMLGYEVRGGKLYVNAEEAETVRLIFDKFIKEGKEDHHRPIVSRETFEQANAILDSRSHAQKGKAKHSNRYAFSGRIQCGYCGATYVARYKKRSGGNQYKLWRCYEAVKNGSPHADEAEEKTGCAGKSIRNEDVLHIMGTVCEALPLDREGIVAPMIRIIEAAILSGNTDVSGLEAKIKRAEDRKNRLIELYMSRGITKKEFQIIGKKVTLKLRNSGN